MLTPFFLPILSPSLSFFPNPSTSLVFLSSLPIDNNMSWFAVAIVSDPVNLLAGNSGGPK